MGPVMPFSPRAPQNNSVGGFSTDRTPSGELDRHAFLMLLLTQLQHQDPLNPMEDRDFLAQMAQFEALTQQQVQTRVLEQQHAQSMIGKTAFADSFWCEEDEAFVDVFGLVVSVTTRDGNILVGIECAETGRVRDVPLDSIRTVLDDYHMEQQMNTLLSLVANQHDMSFIGRTIQAITNDGRRVTGFIEGRVDFVRMQGGRPVLMVGGREVFADEVFSVSDNKIVIGQPLRGRVLEEGEWREIAGYITGISISGDKAHVHIGANPNSPNTPDEDDDEYEENGETTPPTTSFGQVEISRIDYLIEALQLRGTHINHGGNEGVVQYVRIRNGLPYLILPGDRSVSYSSFRRGSSTEETPSANNTPPTNNTPPADNNDDDDEIDEE